ncbi:hypothetical protein [Streptomyces sp. NRRL S-340]|nr:hypothetical protein [Streptomyces sp. NRRL S-340]
MIRKTLAGGASELAWFKSSCPRLALAPQAWGDFVAYASGS